MLIACASDAHGARGYMIRLMEKLPKVGAFCFLGDCDRDAAFLQYALAEAQPKAQFLAVAGNNDPGSHLPGTIEWAFDKTRGLLTHGHLFRVKLSLSPLAEFAVGRKCSLALFGHTHHPEDTWMNGVHMINPGALTYGRWALVNTDESQEARLCRL